MARSRTRYAPADHRVLWAWAAFALLGLCLAVMLVVLWGGVESDPRWPMLATLAVYLGCAHCMRRAAHGMQQDSYSDALTGLANRRALESRLHAELPAAERHGTPLALVLLDVDFLKLINDRGGHAAGDQALRMVSAAMRSVCRSADLPVRLGGDEFVILAPQTSAVDAAIMARRIQDLLAGLSRGTPLQVPLSASAGIASTEMKSCCDAPSLMAVADAALYMAKECGRNRLAIGRTRLTAVVTHQLVGV